MVRYDIYGMVWYGVVWYGTTWYGVVWVWYSTGIVQYDMADRLSKSLAFCVRHTYLMLPRAHKQRKYYFPLMHFGNV